MQRLIILFASLALLCASVMAEEASRPRIGLVLGGGGARGFAHIGVLKVLEENHVPVDCVVGTSIGSLVGAAYAVGRTPYEMQAKIHEANWDDLLSTSLSRQADSFRKKQEDALSLFKIEFGLTDKGEIKLPTAAISTQKIAFFLRDLTFSGTAANFDALPIPYRAVATDLSNGDMVVLDKGDIVTAMRSSMAVPGVFSAVHVGGRILVDGGLSRNLPVDVARKLCADVVIAVDVGSPPLAADKLSNLLDVADQYTRLMMLQNVQPQIASLTSKDVLIQPDLGNLSSSDFKKGDELIAAGARAAQALLPSLQRYALPAAQYDAWQQAKMDRRLQPARVDSVEVAETRHVNPDVLKEAVNVELGKPLDAQSFHEHLENVYARGDFSQLDYELLQDGTGSQNMTLLPVEKAWGPNYLRFGMSLGTDFSSSTPWNLTAMYRRTWINSLGAEWKNVLQIGNSSLFKTEFYQPLQLDGYAFVAPYASYASIPVAMWVNGQQKAEYDYSKTVVGLDLGSAWTRYGELRAGPVFNHYNAVGKVGVDLGPDQSYYDYGGRINLFYDQLDDPYFPSQGRYLSLYGYYSVGGKDEHSRYARYGFNVKRAWPQADGGAFVMNLKGQNTWGDEQPLADVRWLGGFMNLSSYRYQELLGNKLLYGSLQYRRPTPLFSGSYWGVMLEGGRVFDYFDADAAKNWHTSLTAFLGYNSYLGPLYLGAAYGDNKQMRYYLMLGNQF